MIKSTDTMIDFSSFKKNRQSIDSLSEEDVEFIYHRQNDDMEISQV